MIHVLWLGLIVSGIVVAAVEGRMEAVTQAVFEGAKSGVTVCLGLVSVMVFWLGIMRIAEDAGMLRAMARVFRPFIHRLFPSVPPDHPAMGYIVSNVCANVLGLGNAATPAGIKAMQALQTLNPTPHRATAAMCTLLTINTASITLIPTTMVALRMNEGSHAATDIVGPTLLATACALVIALLVDRLAQTTTATKQKSSKIDAS